MILLCLVGYAGHGKSTAGFYFYELCRNLGYTLLTAFGDAVKTETAKVYQFPLELCYSQEGKNTHVPTEFGQKTVRELLVLQSALVKQQTKDDTVWAKKVVETIREKDPAFVVVHDMRYLAEYETLKESFPKAKLFTIRIRNPNAPISSCPSEHNLDNFCTGFTLYNDSTIQILYQQIDQIFKSYIVSSTG